MNPADPQVNFVYEGMPVAGETPVAHASGSPFPVADASGSSGSFPASRGWRRLGAYLVLVIVLLGAGAGAFFWVPGLAKWNPLVSGARAEKQAETAPLAVELVEGKPDTLFVPEQVRETLGIKELAVAERPKKGPPLVMPGSTLLDPTRIMRIRTRFNAEVTEIGKVFEPGGPETSGQSVGRELRPGDRVRKGDTLAVVWSIDIGGKKSDMVDALVQLKLDEKRLEARQKLWKDGYLPEDTLRQTERDVISDRNAYERAVRTLRTWNVPEREIEVAREEAEKTLARKGLRDKEKERLWARSDLIAPRDGTIVERNVGVGEYVADNTINLFTIADISRMQIIANPPEDALPDLLRLKPKQMRWTLRMVGLKKPIEGRIDEIGYILDPNQHTAVVKGHIDNPKDQGMPLRAGQFVRAEVDMPPPQDVVEVPIGALVEDGNRSFVFIVSDAEKHYYTMRRVLVTQRFTDRAFVKSRLTPEEAKRSDEDRKRGVPACQPLLPKEKFLVAGVLELRAALEDLTIKSRK
jgi:cobalt-zinc-cadmium efflux system membrane fusion protein